MRSLLRKTHKGQKGFTLVELLVVFTLLGVLAAIVIPNISGLLGYGHDQAAKTELSIVQTAMDTMMAVVDTATVTEVTVGTQTMSSFPDGDTPLYPNYLRTATTTGNYTCSTSGLVAQSATGYE